ncbi:MAG: type II secretion system protein, partial [Campylobacterota bacterium]|nr:type II secretion system protein [Campylobacterota bacterium]
MKRSAFSLIELLFVIIILGILSAVVVVKLGKMGDQTKEMKLKAMTGTLNRSVSAIVWYQSIMDNHNGSVRFASYDGIMKKSISLIPDYLAEPSLMSCNVHGNGTYLTYVYSKTYE